MNRMKVTLSYEADGRLYITIGAASLEMPRSFSGDLATLAHPFILLLRGLDRATCPWAVGSWFTPPGTYLWTLDRRERSVWVSVEWFAGRFADTQTGKGELVFQAECGLRRFAVQLKNQLQALLVEDEHPLSDLRRSMYQKLDEALREQKTSTPR